MTPIEQAASTPTVALPSMRPTPQAGVARPLPAAGPAPATTPHRLGTASAVVAALVCGVLGLVVTPVLLGPAAILAVTVAALGGAIVLL